MVGEEEHNEGKKEGTQINRRGELNYREGAPDRSSEQRPISRHAASIAKGQGNTGHGRLGKRAVFILLSTSGARKTKVLLGSRPRKKRREKRDGVIKEQPCQVALSKRPWFYVRKGQRNEGN